MVILTWLILLFISSSSASSGMSGNLTLMIPPLTEGQETTLSCTADLCSTSESAVFAWKWTKSMENTSFNINNVTESQKQNSTVTFKPSPIHHGSSVTCQVTCPNNITANVTEVLNVTSSSGMSGNLTLMIPPLTEGQEATLSCTADLCSTNETADFAWKWTKSMENTSFNINNVTESQERNSTITFTPSAIHHGSSVTCQVTCPNNITANVTEVLNVTYVKKFEISGDKTINEGDALNLTCRFDGFPQTLLIWTKLGSNTSKTNGTGAATLFMSKVTAKDSGQYMCTAQNQNRNLTVDVEVRSSSGMSGNLTLMIPPLTEGQETTLSCTADLCSTNETADFAWKWTKSMENTSFNINNVTESQKRNSAITFTPSPIHHGSSVTCQVTCTNNITANVTEVLNVTYVKKFEISGDKTINEGDALNLTCHFDGFPQTLLIWTKLGSNTSKTNGTGAATLFMSKVTAKDSGQYMCTAQNQNRNLTVDVEVRLGPQILDQSDCKSQQDVLTCACISQGFPSPTITWELLQNPINYSISTVVLNHTVTSTISINMKGVSNISAVCISSNTNGKTSRNLSITEVEGERNITNHLWTFTQMGIIIPFLIGVLVSASIFCLLWLCCRKKHKSRGSTSETLEMAMTQETNGGHTVDYEPILVGGAAGGSNASDAGTSDIEYSDVHLLIKQDTSSPSENKPKKEVTEYAKIKKKRETKMEEVEEQEEEEEMKLASVPEGEESEMVAVYSNVTNLKDQM